MMSYGRYRNQLSQCAAEWLDVHRYFNPNQEPFNRDPSVKMLTPNLVSPPANIRLRFEVSDPDGLHQAQLQALTGGSFTLIACQRLSGQRAIAKFVTNDLLNVDVIEIHIIDVHGNDRARRFTYDITDLLPPSDAISIPDPAFAAAIRRSLKLEPNEPITELDMLKLKVVNGGWDLKSPQITDITGVEHAKNTTVLGFFDNQISDITLFASASLPELRTLWLGRNQIRDITHLAGLTQLEDLRLNSNQISDITPLTQLTQLQVLELSRNPIRDYTPLMTLTQLSEFYLYGNQISDVSLLAELKNLKRLGLGYNQISDIRPLAKLTNLETLWLGSNEISDLRPLAELKNLKILYLKNNEISDVSPLTELVNLKELRLEGNPIKNRKPLLALLRKNREMKIYLEGHGEPLPVNLSYFRAEHTDAGVVLNWTTESEVDNAGFYIYRSQTKDGEFNVVNPTMIQGAGTIGERNEYTWTDTTAKPNTVYYYRIEDVSHAGERKQSATVRLRGLVSASGKFTTRWADFKAQH